MYDYDCLYKLNPRVYIDSGGGLGLYKVGLLGKETIHPDIKLAIHAKESPIRTREEILYLVSSWPIIPAHVTQAGRPRTP